ncbi:MAG: 2Fe-2S iron-sulfur cluster-binding protein [Immundisolibacter sp.]|uniref:2Fe-2S iron-sulfur cluster-binding protein n=1 Tax=Immundisolibacter sp. TaxID=1934948 RepID=UPI003EE2E388
MARIRINDGPWRKVMPGSSLLGLIRGRAGIRIHTSCGLGNCGSDIVLIRSGMEHLSPAFPSELRTLAVEGASDNARLSCVTKLLDGDVEIEVPDYSLEQPAA